MNFTDFLCKVYELNKELLLSEGIKIKTFNNSLFIIKMKRTFYEDKSLTYKNIEDIIEDNILDDEKIFEIYSIKNNTSQPFRTFFYMEVFTFLKAHEHIKSVFTKDDTEINIKDCKNQIKINLNESANKIEELIYALDILTEDDFYTHNIVKSLAELLKIKI